MSNELYSTLSGAIGSWRKMESIANNLANASTTGFKAERLLQQSTGPQGAYAQIADAYTHQADGVPVNTGSPTDVALQGPGWLAVQDGDATLLTRDGHLRVDPDDGSLRTSTGHRVQGQAGSVVIPPDTTVRIADDGSISTSDGEFVDTLRVVQGPAEPIGGNLWSPLGELEEIPPRLLSGALEQSNVDPMQTMVELIEASRAFEAFQKLLQTSDDLSGRLNQMGRGG